MLIFHGSSGPNEQRKLLFRIVDEKETATTKEIGLEGFTIHKEFGRDLH
jgi:hypothetical protein